MPSVLCCVTRGPGRSAAIVVCTFAGNTVEQIIVPNGPCYPMRIRAVNLRKPTAKPDCKDLSLRMRYTHRTHISMNRFLAGFANYIIFRKSAVFYCTIPHQQYQILNPEREEFYKENAILEPKEMPGGWSSHGQPVDQCHSQFRRVLAQRDMDSVGQCRNLRDRKRTLTVFHGATLTMRSCINMDVVKCPYKK